VLVVDEAGITGEKPGRALRAPYGRQPERITEPILLQS
jgi:hypothetical protein